ncbi:MAG: hypothetical protein ACLRSU_12800 [Thomasclavelia spiroformis]|uniref:rolling circle replication-associated protein n=1 Tax=Thomasclavelia spiroformis TaxID=29348 RepID=UPI0039906A45
MAVEIRRLEERPDIDLSMPVKVIEMGNVIELQYMSRRNGKQTIQMLKGGEQYIDLGTGEIKDVVHHTTRADQYKSLYRTFRNVRAIINSNVTDVKKVKWITLTYAENMQDTKRLYEDFKKFNQRFQYYIKNLGFNKAEYIVMCEPQGRGAWHCHLLYIFDTIAPFIPNNELERLWGHGFTKTKKLDDVDNVGAYLTAYLGDMDVNDAFKNNSDEIQRCLDGSATIKSVEIDGDKKYYIKGARLSLYPANFNMYRCSRGIKRPVEYMDYLENAEKKVSAGTLTYEKTVEIIDLDNDFQTVINSRQYNMVKKKSK